MNKSYIEMHLAILLAGFSGIFGKLVTLNETLLVFYRVFFSSIFLILIIFLLKRKTEKFSFTKPNILMLLNGALLGLHWVFFFGSIKASTVSLGILCFCLTSFFTALLEPLVNKKKLSVKNLALSSLSLFGISLIFGFDSTYREGIILGIISSILVSLFTLFNENLVKKHASYLKITTFQMIGGTVGLSLIILLFMLFSDFQFEIPTGLNLAYLLSLALLCTVVMYILLNRALRALNSFTVNLNFNLEPIYGIILAFIIFNESENFNGPFWIGVGLIILSLILQSIFSKPFKKEVAGNHVEE